MVQRACLIGCVMMLTAACGDEEQDPAPVMEVDAGDPASACPPTTPEFTTGPAGLSATRPELNLKVRVDDADFQPPRFGTNTWTIAITDLNDQPLPQAQLTWACAYMPAHGHGSNPKLVEKLDPTRWRLERQNMSMQGGWEIQLWIDPDGGSKDFTGAQGGINSMSCRGPQNALPTLKLPTCVPRRADAS
jgi:hypothetical protein